MGITHGVGHGVGLGKRKGGDAPVPAQAPLLANVESYNVNWPLSDPGFTTNAIFDLDTVDNIQTTITIECAWTGWDALNHTRDVNGGVHVGQHTLQIPIVNIEGDILSFRVKASKVGVADVYSGWITIDTWNDPLEIWSFPSAWSDHDSMSPLATIYPKGRECHVTLLYGTTLETVTTESLVMEIDNVPGNTIAQGTVGGASCSAPMEGLQPLTTYYTRFKVVRRGFTYLSNIESKATTTAPVTDIGFEQWSDSVTPVNWIKYMNEIGDQVSNVTSTQEQEKIYSNSGVSGLKLEVASPGAGVMQSIGVIQPPTFKVRVNQGKLCLHYAKDDLTSASFTPRVLLQDNFTLENTVLSTAIRGIRSLRLDNGDLVEIFSASNTAENTYEGDVYIKRNNGNPSLFHTTPGMRTWVFPGFLDLTTKYTWVSMRFDSAGIMRIYATDIDRTFTTKSNERLLYEIVSTNLQSYNLVKLSSGRIVIPVTYAATSQISGGPWYVDILYSDDNLATITRLNSPKTYVNRGLMEPHPVILSNGTVAILCRTDQGYMAKAIYDPVGNTLSNAVLTDIVNPESGCYAMNLSNGKIALIWNTAIKKATSSYPRKVIALAISSDDMVSWESYHTIITSAAMGDSMVTDTPYVHQPFMHEDGLELVAYFEKVINTSTISLYKTTGTNIHVNNTINSINTWESLTTSVPASATRIQLISIVNSNAVAYLDSADNPINPSAIPVPDTVVFTVGDTIKTVQLSNSEGVGIFSYSVSDNADWLTVTPSSGEMLYAQLLTLEVNRGTLAEGTYNAVVTVTSESGVITTINVSMAVAAPPSSNGLLTGLVHLWKLDEESGTTFADTVGTATLTSVLSVIPNQAAPANIVKSLQFDGGTAKTINDAVAYMNTPSFAFWFKSTDPVAGDANFLLSAEGGWGVSLTGTNINGLQVTFAGSMTGVPTLGSYNDGAWHHLMAVYSDGNTKVYIDGVLINTYTQTLYNIGALNRPFAVGGRYDGSAQFSTKCHIAQVAMWDTPRTAEQATLLYNGGAGLHSTAWGN